MKLRTIHRDIERALTRSWRTLGVPAIEEAVDEKRQGVVDPEALLIATISLSS